MEKGASDELAGNHDSLYCSFYRACIQAGSLAKVTAEKEVFVNSPISWLTMSPARQTNSQEGWTRGTSTHEVTERKQITIITSWGKPQTHTVDASITPQIDTAWSQPEETE